MSEDKKQVIPEIPRRISGIVLLIAILLAVGACIADQISKEVIVRHVPLYTRHVVIPGFFNITHMQNTGAAWGILNGRLWLLLVISFSAAGLIFTFFRQLTEGYAERVFALLLIVSGIVGNCTDRIFRGAVIDFLEFYIGPYIWPSFNVADSCICIGVGLFVLSSLFRPENKKKQA